MSGNKAELTVTVGEGGGGIEVGDTVTGTITGTQLNERDVPDEDEPVTYFTLEIEEHASGMTFSPSYPANVSPSTLLGGVLMNFGVDLTVGEDLNVHDYLKPGVDVAFEIVQGGERDDGGHFLNAGRDSVRPAEEADADVGSVSETEESSDDDDGDADDAASERVLEIVDENEGESDSDIKKLIVAEDGDLLSTYKQLKASGEIEEVDGSVLLA